MQPDSNITRFWSKVDKSGDCWLWTTSVSKAGYGFFWFSGRTELAHRMSWRFHFGAIPEGMMICHTCDNPSCVNPNHLFLGTAADNAKDRESKGRGANNRPPNKGEANGRAKLTVKDVQEIRRLLNEGHSGRSIAKQFGVSGVMVSFIKRGLSWKSDFALGLV